MLMMVMRMMMMKTLIKAITHYIIMTTDIAKNVVQAPWYPTDRRERKPQNQDMFTVHEKNFQSEYLKDFYSEQF